MSRELQPCPASMDIYNPLYFFWQAYEYDLTALITKKDFFA